MIFARSHIDLHNIRASIERTKRLSDNVTKIGPVGVGLDGLLQGLPEGVLDALDPLEDLRPSMVPRLVCTIPKCRK